MQIEGYIHSVETGGMVDGPGIRYVIFLAGCPLRCKYCHNPDTWKMIDGRHATVAEVMNDVKKYRSFMKFSGGGVTVTGGEPFAQPEFLTAILRECTKLGIHTAIDTSGYASHDAAAEALAYTDLLLLDIKSLNPVVYKKLTGVSLGKTLEMLELAKRLSTTVWVRYVLVPGYTDNIGDIKNLAEYLTGFKNIERVEVLPFHKMGEYKWETLGVKYELHDVEPPTAELLEEVKSILEFER